MKRQPRTSMMVCATLSLAVGVGCMGSTEPAPTPRAVPAESPGVGVALDRVPLVVLELPSDARDGRPPSQALPLDGWEPVPDATVPTFEIDAPIRPRATFFDRAPRGTALRDHRDRTVPYAAGSLRRWWRFADGRIRVQVPGGAEDLSGLRLISATASAREARLNPSFSGINDPEAFVRARLHLEGITREGLLLPAPAQAAADVVIPAGGELHFTPVLLPPELRDLPAGDGATIVVHAEIGGERHELRRVPLQREGAHPEVHIDLSEWAGQRIRLHLSTEPGASSRFDYVFLADPVVASRSTAPRRAVVVFIDTLRADHLPTYGYARDTAPWIASKAAQGAVFERAHSVAPWTLPAWRSLWTGRRPTAFGAGPTLGDALRKRGFATGMVAANLYLGDSFAGTRGFGHHQVEHLAPASAQVDRALKWLDDHADRDALLVLHLMDPHLPYTEPQEFRERFAGSAPDPWPHGDSFVRSAVAGVGPAARTWIEDRYDNNIAYVDHELARLDRALLPDDVLVVLSDHGEEFWDHGGFEHGHSLHEELVRVPLIFRGPGIAPGRHDAPVSLLDVAPTLARHLGVELPDAHGQDLGGLLDASAADTFPTERVLPLGHPLYGFERWGVSTGTRTYETHAGWEKTYILANGAQTEAPIADVQPWRQRLQAAHDHPVVESLRIAVKTRARGGSAEDLQIDLAVDDQVEVWLGEDATAPVPARLERDEAGVHLHIPRRFRGSRELYLSPPPTELTIHVSRAGKSVMRADLPSQTFPNSPTFFEQRVGDVVLSATTAVTLRPDPSDTPTYGFDPELRSMLEAAGYLR